MYLAKLLATERGGNIKTSGVVFGDTADIEVTTAEALRKQYSIADSARATGFLVKTAGVNITAIRCSFLVEYASDQPPRRHCLASKKGKNGFTAFLGTDLRSNAGKWLVEHGQAVVSLQYGRVATKIPNRC